MTKESTWDECRATHTSLTIRPDIAKAKSLLDTIMGRNNYLTTQTITEESANYIFEGYYASAVELTHVILLVHGYKVLNHICVCYYFRDVLKREDIFRLFDESRLKRNALVYEGRTMKFEIAKKAIETCTKLISELQNMTQMLLKKEE